MDGGSTIVPTLHTLFGKGTLLEINRTSSRSTLTVQDMTVDKAIQPILPSIATPRCELAPISRHCYARSQRREERGSPAMGTSLAVSRSLVGTIVSWLSSRAPEYSRRGVSQPILPPKGTPIHPPLGKTGAFWAVHCKRALINFPVGRRGVSCPNDV